MRRASVLLPMLRTVGPVKNSLRYVGLDFAWGERARTGIAILDETGRLAASTSVVTDDDIAAFIARHTRGPVAAAGSPAIPGYYRAP